jgi:hypothetical protein
MPVLPDYEHFHGRHPETGSVHNILSYQGVSAPHTGKPYSEAMLLGVSGGSLSAISPLPTRAMTRSCHC